MAKLNTSSGRAVIGTSMRRASMPGPKRSGRRKPSMTNKRKPKKGGRRK